MTREMSVSSKRRHERRPMDFSCPSTNTPLGSGFTAAATADRSPRGDRPRGQELRRDRRHAGIGLETTAARSPGRGRPSRSAREIRTARHGRSRPRTCRGSPARPRGSGVDRRLRHAVERVRSVRSTSSSTTRPLLLPRRIVRDARGYELQFATSPSRALPAHRRPPPPPACGPRCPRRQRVLRSAAVRSDPMG